MDRCTCGEPLSINGVLKSEWFIRRHRDTCSAYQITLQSIAEKAKENNRAHKRRKLLGGYESQAEIAGQGQSSGAKNVESIEDTPDPTSNFSGSDTNMLMPPLIRLASPDPLIGHIPRRVRRLPARYRDNLPEGPSVQQVPETQQDSTETSDNPPGPENLQHPRIYETAPNSFGLFRRYLEPPSLIPDGALSLRDLEVHRENADSRGSVNLGGGDPETSKAIDQLELIYPFPNISSLLLLESQYHGVTKSKQDFRHLLNCLRDPRYIHEEAMSVDYDKLESQLDAIDRNPQHILWSGEGWKETSVRFRVPLPKVRGYSDPPPPQQFSVLGFQHRSIVAVVTSALKKMRAPNASLHYIPFRQYWKSPTPQLPNHSERTYDELYTSDAWIKAHLALRDLSPLDERGEPCTLPRAIAGIMLWSDATQLANFGTAKLWPCYLFLSNQSKFWRGKPSARECHHLAYFSSLPDSIQDFITKISADGSGAKDALLSHLRRELFHAMWDILLDDDFLDAYENGIAMTCGDGIRRRIYFRIFTYSADYPEKVLLACIRNNGRCPCPTCKIEKKDIHEMGMKRDATRREHLIRQDDFHLKSVIKSAREKIYDEKVGVGGQAVEDLLAEHSLVPTVNAFSKKLGHLGFDFHQMIVPDLLHECELGTWKAIFKHLIRLLYKLAPENINTLNERYRMVPTYGQGVIRRFQDNAADMKNMAGHDYEDLLQCAIPVFEGLIPNFEDEVQDLLFSTANCHALAKLHIHTTSTVCLLKRGTATFGRNVRRFKRVTDNITVTETPSEVQARLRRDAKKAEKAAARATATGTIAPAPTKKSQSGPKIRKLNVNTFKYHNQPHWPRGITDFGTMDSYSTSPCELQHKVAKRLYKRTNKNRFEGQIATQVRRQEQIQRTMEAVDHAENAPSSQSTHNIDIEMSSRYGQHKDQKNKLPIYNFDLEFVDPAYKDFSTNLLDHILDRFAFPNRTLYDDPKTYSDRERRSIAFHNDVLYIHRTMPIHYTTYDIKRAQDTISTNTQHCDIMVLSGEEGTNTHPFWYARVLGIYHANVITSETDDRGRRMDFLYVRWFARDSAHRSGWKRQRLDRVGFLNEAEEAFSFLDPALVVRTCHLIPAYAYGITQGLLGVSTHRPDDGEWEWYYVNRFVDRDMMMRYTDLGIGHRGLRTSEPFDGAVSSGDEPEESDMETEGPKTTGERTDSNDDDIAHHSDEPSETESDSNSDSEDDSDE